MKTERLHEGLVGCAVGLRSLRETYGHDANTRSRISVMITGLEQRLRRLATPSADAPQGGDAPTEDVEPAEAVNPEGV